MDAYKEEFCSWSEGAPRTAVKRLTKAIETSLTERTINAPDWDTLYVARMARDILWSDDKSPVSLDEFTAVSGRGRPLLTGKLCPDAKLHFDDESSTPILFLTSIHSSLPFHTFIHTLTTLSRPLVIRPTSFTAVHTPNSHPRYHNSTRQPSLLPPSPPLPSPRILHLTIRRPPRQRRRRNPSSK